MNQQLGFSSLEYGIGGGLYYAGFGVAMLPSTFMTMRFGARLWMGSMAIVWGIISTCHALIRSKTGFYVLRCLLGLAEAAGSSSGGHLIAQFYPKNRLAMPFTVVVLSQIVSGVVAAPLAAGLVSLDGTAGLHGWQWLFIVEGVPSVILGMVTYWLLPSHPLWDAWMLTPQEREMLHLRVHGTPEKAEAARSPPRWSQFTGLIKDAVKNLSLWFFVLVGILWGLGFFSLYTWLPVVVQNMLSGTALVNSTSSGLRPGVSGQTPTKAILLTGIPSLTAAFAMVAVAWHSDRVNEKALHVAVPYLLGGLFLLCYTPMASTFAGGFVNLVIAMTAANAATGVISSRVVVCFDTKAVGIGLAIYTLLIALFSGFAGPVIAGALVQEMGSFSQAMYVNGAVMVGAGLLMLGLFVWERRQARLAASAADLEDQLGDTEDEEEEKGGHQDVVAVDSVGGRSRDASRTRKRDIELAVAS